LGDPLPFGACPVVRAGKRGTDRARTGLIVVDPEQFRSHGAEGFRGVRVSVQTKTLGGKKTRALDSWGSSRTRVVRKGREEGKCVLGGETGGRERETMAGGSEFKARKPKKGVFRRELSRTLRGTGGRAGGEVMLAIVCGGKKNGGRGSTNHHVIEASGWTF